MDNLGRELAPLRMALACPLVLRGSVLVRILFR